MRASDGSWHVPSSLLDDIADFLSYNLSQVHPPRAYDDQFMSFGIGHPSDTLSLKYSRDLVR